MRNKILILIGLFIVIAGLFFFSSWNNAMVVSDIEAPSGVRTFSLISPFLAGLFVVVMTSVLIRISSEY